MPLGRRGHRSSGSRRPLLPVDTIPYDFGEPNRLTSRHLVACGSEPPLPRAFAWRLRIAEGSLNAGDVDLARQGSPSPSKVRPWRATRPIPWLA
jgi:hypothetical protein